MRWTTRISLALLVAGSAGCGGAPGGPETAADRPADLLIRGARIVDGAGGPWFRANLAVSGDRILGIGPGEPDAAEVLDAAGMVLAPGFIDMHAHSEYGLVVDPRALSKVAQGVTTEVLGEHLSAGPVLGPAVDDPMMVAPPVERDWTTLGGYLDRLDFAGVGPNVVSYVGSGQVRASVIGYEERAASAGSCRRWKRWSPRRWRRGRSRWRAAWRTSERLCQHGGTHPPGAGGGVLRRLLCQPSPGRARGTGRGHRDRP